MTKCQFFSEVQLVWIHSFLSPRLVAIPSLKSLVHHTIQILLWKESSWIHSFPKRISAICEQPPPGFEHSFQNPFPMK